MWSLVGQQDWKKILGLLWAKSLSTGFIGLGNCVRFDKQTLRHFNFSRNFSSETKMLTKSFFKPSFMAHFIIFLLGKESLEARCQYSSYKEQEFMGFTFSATSAVPRNSHRAVNSKICPRKSWRNENADQGAQTRRLHTRSIFAQSHGRRNKSNLCSQQPAKITEGLTTNNNFLSIEIWVQAISQWVRSDLSTWKYQFS